MELHEPISQLIFQFTNELIFEGVSKNIFKILEKLYKETESSTVSDQQSFIMAYKNEEKKLLSQCLFFIYYQTTIEEEDALMILQLFFQYSQLFTNKTKKLENTIYSELFQVNFFILKLRNHYIKIFRFVIYSCLLSYLFLI